MPIHGGVSGAREMVIRNQNEMLKAEQWPFAVFGTDGLSVYHVQSCS